MKQTYVNSGPYCRLGNADLVPTGLLAGHCAIGCYLPEHSHNAFRPPTMVKHTLQFL